MKVCEITKLITLTEKLCSDGSSWLGEHGSLHTGFLSHEYEYGYDFDARSVRAVLKNGVNPNYVTFGGSSIRQP